MIFFPEIGHFFCLSSKLHFYFGGNLNRIKKIVFKLAWVHGKNGLFLLIIILYELVLTSSIWASWVPRSINTSATVLSAKTPPKKNLSPMSASVSLVHICQKFNIDVIVLWNYFYLPTIRQHFLSRLVFFKFSWIKVTSWRSWFSSAKTCWIRLCCTARFWNWLLICCLREAGASALREFLEFHIFTRNG